MPESRDSVSSGTSLPKDETIDILLGDVVDNDSLGPLFEASYSTLRRLAVARLRRYPRKTLQPTALINELYLELRQLPQVTISSRYHFFALCAKILSRILLHYIRDRSTQKRGGQGKFVQLDDAPDLKSGEDDARLNQALIIAEALEKLEKLDSRQATVVRLRFFMGLTYEEISSFLRMSQLTAKRDWASAKQWLALTLADTSAIRNSGMHSSRSPRTDSRRAQET